MICFYRKNTDLRHRSILLLSFLGKFLQMAVTFHSDPALWRAFQLGSRDALNSLFRTYYPGLYKYGTKICGDCHIAEESLQDFFAYLYEHRKGLSEPRSIKAYLFMSYRRRLLTQLEKDRSNRFRKNLGEALDAGIQFSIEELIIQEESEYAARETLLLMLNSLPKRQREIIYLRYFDDLPLTEIADVLSISYQGAVNMTHKAIKSLRANKLLAKVFA